MRRADLKLWPGIRAFRLRIFPRTTCRKSFLQPSNHHTYCGWKRTANYYDVVVDGEVADKGPWYYPEPMEGAEQVADRIAFCRGVKVSP